MCLTVTQPPPGLFFWNWNKNAELFNLIFFENALQAPLYSRLCSLFYPQKDQLLQLHVIWDAFQGIYERLSQKKCRGRLFQ